MSRKGLENSKLAAVAVIASIILIAGATLTLNESSQTAPSPSEPKQQQEQENQENLSNNQQESEKETSNLNNPDPKTREISLKGEEEYEEYLSSSVDVGDIDVDKSGYHWVEFENTSNQLTQPVPDELPNKVRLDYIIKENLRTEGLGEFDSLYLVIRKDYDGEDPEFTYYTFVEDEWDSSLSAEENMDEIGSRFAGINPVETDLGVLETLLSENVQDYSEVSEDFPEEYQGWLDS